MSCMDALARSIGVLTMLDVPANSHIVGYPSDYRERFDRGETVSILCKAGGYFLYRVKVRKRG